MPKNFVGKLLANFKKRVKSGKINATKIAQKIQPLIAIKAKKIDSSAEPISL